MPMMSFLVEISLIDKQILISAFGMGMVAQDFKTVLSKKKSREVMEEYKGGNWERFWDKIQVDVDGIRIVGDTEEDNAGENNIQDNSVTPL